MRKFLEPHFHLTRKIALAFLLEFGPVILFLLSFEFFHIYKATIILMIATIISTIVTYVTQKRLPYLALYVALLTSVFGYITLTHHQPKFIQMRDTLYDVTLAFTLIIGLMIRVPLLKVAFHKVIPMTNRAWDNLTHAWIFYFITIAVANEYVRRTMSLTSWFDFKSIVIAITVIYGLITIHYLYEKENNKKLGS